MSIACRTLVPPHLRRHVVRSTDLCLSHTILGALSHAQVAYFEAARARDEDVWRLDAVQNFGSVKLLEALADLDEKGPDQALDMRSSRFKCRFSFACTSPPRASSVTIQRLSP